MRRLNLENRQVLGIVLVTTLLSLMVGYYLYPILGVDPGDVSTFYLDRGTRYESTYVVGVWNSTHYYGMNGTTGQREFLSSNASELIQSAIDGATGQVHVREGTYNVNNTITIDKRIVFRGSGESTIFDLSDGITGFNVTDQATLKDFRIDTQGNILSTDLLSIGIHFHSVSMFQTENVYVTRTGIGFRFFECNGGTSTGLKTYNCYIGMYFTGSGSGYTAYMSQWTSFLGCNINYHRSRAIYVEHACYVAFYNSYICAATDPIFLEEFKNLLFDHCSFENTAYSDDEYMITMDDNGSHYRRKLIIRNGAFDCYGIGAGSGLDGIYAYNVTGITIDGTTIANIRSGHVFLNVSSCSQVEVLKPRLYQVDLVYDGDGVYYYYERTRGNNTISASTSVTFNHYLSGTPNVVYLSWEDTGYTDWKWNASATQITITVTSSGTYNFHWVAEYRPMNYTGI